MTLLLILHGQVVVHP